MLIGSVESCALSGTLLLQDDSGSFPLLLTFNYPTSKQNPSDHDCFDLCHLKLGTRIIVTDFTIICEKTINLSSTDAPSSDITMYLHVTDFYVLPDIPASSGTVDARNTESSFLLRDREDGNSNVVYFRVVNKNCSMVSSSSRLEFSCQALAYTKFTSPTGQSKIMKDDKNLSIQKDETVMSIVVHFGGHAYKWHPLIQVGYTYEVALKDPCNGVLPSWNVLSKNLVLSVTEDMSVKLVEGGGGECGGCDVGDISLRLLLPGFPTRTNPQSTNSTK